MIEQKFHQFKQSVKPEEFNSIEFLQQKAKELKESDEALSNRILVRVTNLNKQRQHQMNGNDSRGKKQETSKSTEHKAIVALNDEHRAVSTELIKVQSTKLEVKASSITSYSAFLKNNPFICLVVIPALIFASYQLFWATERNESQAQVIVQQPDGMATMDASMAVLTGLGVSNTGISDTELVKAYIYSNDMLQYLDQELKLREHYSQGYIDFFSRMHESGTREDFLDFYTQHVKVYIDSNSNVIHIYSQAFDADYAQRLAQTIVNRAEWYINSIGHQLAEAQLEFIKGEHQLVEKKLEDAQKKLLNFQQQYNLLDPAAEGAAMQQITYTLEGQISAKEAELKGLKAIMSPKAPQVITIENELSALRAQLLNERNKLSKDSNETIPVSEILARYTDYKIRMELALQAYTSSQVSLEKSRIEAYRQLKYLVVVESATHPEESKYPDSFYNIALFTLLASMIFAIGKIIISTIRELK